MALYEPNNITPDQKYSIGNGTIDVNDGLTVAWQVNGNAMTPMTGYSIEITENNADNTPVYSTPVKQLATPFSGADALGNPIRYEFHIPKNNVLNGQYFSYSSETLSNVAVDFSVFASKFSERLLPYVFNYSAGSWWYLGSEEGNSLSQYGISYSGTPAQGDLISVMLGKPFVNGKEYKMVITQFWADGSVTQKSPSVFITRAKPVLALTAFSNPLTTRLKTFTASYTQAQGDALTWVRWQIALADDLNAPLYDSGRIYGAGSLEASYDGFFTGNSYAIRCDGETVNGISASTGWSIFSVSYTMNPTSATLSASCEKGRSAVRLKWSGLEYFPADGSGYQVANDQLLLSGVSSLADWIGAMGSAPWSAVYNAEALKVGGARYNEAISIGGFENGNSLLLMVFTGKLSVAYVSRSTDEPVEIGSKSYDNASKVAMYVRPSDNPAYPAASYVLCTVSIGSSSGSFSELAVYVPLQQASLSRFQLSGQQTCNFVQTFDASKKTAVDQWLSTGGTIESYVAARDSATVAMTQWHLGRDTLNAGTIDVYPSQGTLTVYRAMDGVLSRVAAPLINAGEVYDYAAGSRQGPFTYYGFPDSADETWYAPITTGLVNPCWWDWTLLSCVEEADNRYRVEQEFHFGNNLSTGAISNNNAPSLWNNFTRYPTIQRAPQNYQSGSLTSLIGVTADGEYTDTIAARDAIWALSTTQNTLFLKNRKGDVLMVAISGAITMQTGDNTPQQTQTATIPWVEIGSADGVQIYSLS